MTAAAIAAYVDAMAGIVGLDLRAEHRDGVIALVLPEPLTTLVRCLLEHSEELGDLWKVECECGSWSVVDVQPATVSAAP